MHNGRAAENHVDERPPPADRPDSRKRREPRRLWPAKQTRSGKRTRIASLATRAGQRDTAPTPRVTGRSFAPTGEACSLQQAKTPEPPAACIFRSCRRGPFLRLKNSGMGRPGTPMRAHVGETAHPRDILLVSRRVPRRACSEAPPMPPWRRGPRPPPGQSEKNIHKLTQLPRNSAAPKKNRT